MQYLLTDNCCLQNGHVLQAVRVCISYVQFEALEKYMVHQQTLHDSKPRRGLHLNCTHTSQGWYSSYT